MQSYFLAEKLKYRHTFMKGMTISMPLISVVLAAWLTQSYFAVDSYNWWYMGLYPGFLGILCGIIGGKDKKKKNLTIGSLPCSMKRIWDAKILVGILMSAVSVFFLVILTMAAGWGMEHGMHIIFFLQPSMKAQITAGIVMWLTTLWQIPFCLLLSQKMGIFPMLLVHMGSGTLISVFVSLKPWFALFPGAITSRLMCPILGILPNGLPAMEGQMTYFEEIVGMENLMIGIPASVLWFALFWWGSRKAFCLEMEGKGGL